MRKVFFSFYLFGLLFFFASFFANVTPSEMTTSEGSEVENWETGKTAHFHLAINPLLAVANLLDVISHSSGYEHELKGDGYESYLIENIKRFFLSIPVSIGWFTIFASILLIWHIWTQKITKSKLRYFLKAGSVFMLLAAPILAIDFYGKATTYKPYFHLGTGAYFIVAAYLLIGTALLKLIKSEK
jgi:hypothetical protein